jgi:hypothetical protein
VRAGKGINKGWELKMAGEAWVLLGTAVGATGPLLTTWLTAYLKNNEDGPYDASAMKILEEQLNLHEWTDIKIFEKMIGLDRNNTRQYLILLKARGSRKPKSMKWGLISKNPFSEVDKE